MVKRYSKIEVKDGRETIFIEEIGYAKGSFQDDLRKYANGLLNSHGGVIYFGVSSSGTVKGKTISRREEDELRLAVDHAFGGFQPFVSSKHYRLTFLPLDHCNYSIIELKVSIGELGEIYEDGRLKVYIIDSTQLIGPLHPQELKELILLKYKQSIEGAEEAAKYCTPNLSRAKTIALTAKKPTAMATIPEVPPVEKPVPVKITRMSEKASNETKGTPESATPTNIISASSANKENESTNSTISSITSTVQRNSSASGKDKNKTVSSSSTSASATSITMKEKDRNAAIKGPTENTEEQPAKTTKQVYSKSNSNLVKSTPKIRANVTRTHSVCRTPIYHRYQDSFVQPMQFNNLPIYNQPLPTYNRPVYPAFNQQNFRRPYQLPSYNGFF